MNIEEIKYSKDNEHFVKILINGIDIKDYKFHYKEQKTKLPLLAVGYCKKSEIS